jgi:hypothetical protein
MPAPSFLNVEMPPLALPPSSWEKASFLGSNEFGNQGNDFYDGRSRASSLPHDNRRARQQQSMRYPLDPLDMPDVVPSLDPISSSMRKNQPPPSTSTVPFPIPTTNDLSFGNGSPSKQSSPNKNIQESLPTRISTRSRAGSIEQTLERVLSSSLLGFNESDALSPPSMHSQPHDVTTKTDSMTSQQQTPSKLSELMVEKTEEETMIQFPHLVDTSQSRGEEDFGFIDVVEDEEDDTTNMADPACSSDSSSATAATPIQTTKKFGSSDFGMFVEQHEVSPKRHSDVVDGPSQITIPMGGVFRSRSSSSPISEGSRSGSLSGSVTALSILSTSRGTSGNSLLESDAFTERMNTEAIISPSPVPFPAALRSLSKEVETRAAARSFDLSASPPPPPNLQTSNSPNRLTSSSRTQQIAPLLSDSAEWEAVRQQPMMEAPFDMEV